MNLRYGLSRAVPDGTKAAWGARLIAPADLVWDRQDISADDDDAKRALVVWLNGDDGDTPAIRAMLDRLRDMRLSQDYEVTTIFEDERGQIIGSTNRSYGYVYVAGWLK